MKRIHPSREKKKLILLTLGTAILLTFLVFGALIFLSSYNEFVLLDRYISSFPRIVEERSRVLTERAVSVGDDCDVRAELAVLLYGEYADLSQAERLELVRDAVSARSVTLVGPNGRVWESTDPEIPSLMPAIEPDSMLNEGQQVFDLFRSQTEEEAANGDYGFHSIAALREIPGLNGQKLIVETDTAAYRALTVEYGTWSTILERMLSGLDAYAFINLDGTEIRSGYPLDPFTEEDLVRLDEELGDIFRNTNSFARAERSEGLDTAYGYVTLLGTPCFALSLSCPEQGVTVLLARPMQNFLSSTMLNAVSLSAFLALSLILLLRYLSMRRADGYDGSAEPSAVRGRFAAAPAMLILISAVVCFTVMLLFLESKATTAYTNTAQLDALRFELRYAEGQKKLVEDETYERYLVRADAVSRLLTDKPELRERETLRRFCAVAQAEYMMLFDKSGAELFSSNAYTGFSVGSDESDPKAAYRAVLMGYPHILTEPAADPVTGELQFGIASLILDEEGLPDGFLLTAVRADALTDELDSYSPAATVNKFAVQDGRSAAVVNEKSGLFTAHTDPNLVGMAAADVFSPSVLGRDYEGFTLCDGTNVFLSAASDGNLNTLVFAREQSSELLVSGVLILLALILLIVCLIFYPLASALYAGLPLPPQHESGLPRRRNPLVVFLNGYVAFLTVFTLAAWLASRRGYWPAFRFVFDRSWSRGVHLFSLWAALLFLSVTFSAVALVRAILARADDHLSLQTRTISRLVDSLITYAAVIVIVCCILTMFGVNTAAFLASAGIVSIAIGMGAKDLIADILAGLFLIFEGSVHVGDAVTVGGWSGTVTDMGIRTMEISNDAGDVKIISNARISEIVNKSRRKKN